jgi:hypothetical protein
VAKMKQIAIDVDVNRAIENNRLSFGESENDILRRMIVGQTSTTQPPRKPSSRQFRQRGEWEVHLNGDAHGAANLKDAYCQLLRLLGKRDPAFLDTFAGRQARARRFVARKPEALYLNSPHLAKDHAERLQEGWYVDTNLSKEQVASRAREAADTAGLIYGSQVKITEAGQTI